MKCGQVVRDNREVSQDGLRLLPALRRGAYFTEAQGDRLAEHELVASCQT